VGEEEFRAAAGALELGRAQLEAMARQEELLRLSLEEYLRARETMVRFRDAGVGTEILVPIGANSFLFGTVKETGKCIVGVGSSVAFEEPVGKAVERLEARIKQMTEVQEALAARIQEMEEKVQQYSLVVQQEYEKLQRGGSPPG
jgi:prefoldin alpha subunit